MRCKASIRSYQVDDAKSDESNYVRRTTLILLLTYITKCGLDLANYKLQIACFTDKVAKAWIDLRQVDRIESQLVQNVLCGRGDSLIRH